MRNVLVALLSLHCFCVVHTSLYVEDECRANKPHNFIIGLSSASGHLRASRAASYSAGRNCSFTLFSQHDIIVSIKKIRFRAGCYDYLKISDGTKNIALCGTKNELDTNMQFYGRRILMHYFTDAVGSPPEGFLGFHLTYTPSERGSRCDKAKKFMCDNGYCVSNYLVCDNNNNCGDFSDEKGCTSKSGIVTFIAMFIVSIMGIVGGFCVSTCLNAAFSKYLRRNSRTLHYVEDECSSADDLHEVLLRLPQLGPDSVGELRSNRFGTHSRTGRRCLLKLLPPERHGLIVTVLRVDFRHHQGCKDFIKIHAEKEDERICGSQKLPPNGRSFFSNGEMKILYNTNKGGTGFREGFKLVFTVTKMGDNSSCTSLDEFKCQNMQCIWAGVTCDGVDNCGDGSDEDSPDHRCSTYQRLYKNFFTKLGEITPVAVVAVVLGVFSFVSALALVCLCCCSTQPPLLKSPEKCPLRSHTVLLPRHTYGAVSQTYPQQWSVIHASAPPMAQLPSCPLKLEHEPPPPYTV